MFLKAGLSKRRSNRAPDVRPADGATGELLSAVPAAAHVSTGNEHDLHLPVHADSACEIATVREGAEVPERRLHSLGRHVVVRVRLTGARSARSAHRSSARAGCGREES